MARNALDAVPLERFAAVKAQLDRLKQHKDKIAAKADEMVDHAVRSAEIGVTGYALGAVEGYFGEMAPFGVPIELGVAVLGHAGAIVMPDSKAASHMRNIADAGLGVFGYKQGKEAGLKFGKAADEQLKDGKTSPTVKGDLPEATAGTAGKLSDAQKAELEELAKAQAKK